jgi:hypothetical protein
MVIAAVRVALEGFLAGVVRMARRFREVQA